VDSRGNPMADGGICATLRDLARFGQLYLQRGLAAGRPVVPAAWIDDTIRGAPDGAHAFASGDGSVGYPPGAHYRNCWWIHDPGLPFFRASGINGQNVFVHVPSQTVVAKLSTWPTALSAAALGVTTKAVLAIGNALRSGQLDGKAGQGRWP
jgi:CubicO group peptidase (beta-lactamase class C family)